MFGPKIQPRPELADDTRAMPLTPSNARIQEESRGSQAIEAS